MTSLKLAFGEKKKLKGDIKPAEISFERLIPLGDDLK